MEFLPVFIGRADSRLGPARAVVGFCYGKVIRDCQPEATRDSYYRDNRRHSFAISRRDTPEL
jgi:hypothetical protein